MNEQALIERLKQGDQTAFKEIVETWQDMVYNTAVGILQSVEDAEDISQEVFVQVYESIHTFKGESKFSTWLYRITLSKAMDLMRRKKRKKRFALYKEHYLVKMMKWPCIRPEFNHPGIVIGQQGKSIVLFNAIKAIARKPAH